MTLTPKQEAFCQAIIKGINSSKAYRQVYEPQNMNPASVNRTAKKLMDNGKIQSRLAELRAPIIEELQLSLKTHLEDLKTLREEAKNKGQFAAAITAEIARGSAAGHYEPKKQEPITGMGDLLREIANRLPD